ncbi:MAG: hypothetical protein E7634_06420 [Ruminococcaceae bacterium]|nr:hypothetical protein [Oscillospiraceae bacterium]MBQ9692437.1 hypothetical protein [Clostridia bacterium]
MKNSIKISFSAILTAISVIIMLLGGLIGTLDLTAAALASFCIVFAVIEFGYKYAALIYAAASLLGFLLLPAKTCVLFYAAFLGFYPIVKSIAEKYSTKIAYIIKYAVYAVSYTVIILLWIGLFAKETEPVLLVAVILPISGAIVLPIYDIALSKLITLYLQSLRGKWGIDKYLK